MQNDEDISPDGQYLGFTLTPHGLVWKVSLPSSTTTEGDNLYSHWKAIPSPLVHFNPSSYPPGSWEFAAATIANDARYQGGLFALSHWIERGRAAQQARDAAKYVLGMQYALQLLTQVEADAAVADGSWGLTYDSYDLAKNTALAAMRFTSGLEHMGPLIAPLKEHQKRNGATRQEKAGLQKLQKLLLHLEDTRQRAVERIKTLLPDMKLRQDHNTKAFENFVTAQTQQQRKNTKKKSKQKRSSKRKQET
ncbi:unnamed protein product [Phytophthora lilii]|uniref:Unnamed protein product n=1 Tax=Phytophthora lilii TaxID=2077276 RepID=A0A9W6X3Q8_9STRA|nr:unnamed protein product [Phytophthora lilii]